MDQKEAANIISAISSSLRENPRQFHLHISVAGFSAQNTGGVGYLAQNTGGVGFNSNMGDANIQISNQHAGAAIDGATAGLLRKLEEMEAQLRQPSPDKTTLKTIADAVYAEKWVPGVITAVIAGVLKSAGF